jgi:hypothetical protein
LVGLVQVEEFAPDMRETRQFDTSRQRLCIHSLTARGKQTFVVG